MYQPPIFVSEHLSGMEQVHLYVVHNDNEVESYIESHKGILRRLKPNKNKNWVTIEHNRIFISWLKDHIRGTKCSVVILIPTA